MKTLLFSKHRRFRIRRAINVCILAVLATSLLIFPATGVFANNLISGSTASLKLTIPPKGCDTNQPTCLVDSLNLHYMIVHSPVGVKLAMTGVFQDSCTTGSSMLVGTTDQLSDGSDTRDITENVVLQKIPQNWVFCLFLSQGGKSQLFAQGNFTVGADGLTANTNLQLVAPPPIAGSTASLKLTVPPKGCDTNQPSCLVDSLDLHYVIIHSLTGIKLAMTGVFQDSCTGSSMLVGTTNQIADGNDTRDITENVILQKIPQNWVFCLFLSQGGKSQLFAQGNFTPAADGLTANTNLQLVPSASYPTPS